MADNVNITLGDGTGVIAADEIASAKYQRVKLIQGADGVNDGDVSSAAPLNVTLANGSVPSHAVTNAGTFAVQAAQSGTWTVQPGNTANTTAWKVDGSAVTQPVSLTSTTITGTVAVTQSGTWDEVGINDSGNSITVDNAQLSVVGGGTEATAMRVTIASDSTGVLSVDDNGGALTVDGTVAATQSGTWTVQPGNTANTTAWKVDASSVAVPVTDNSGSLTVDYATTGSGTATGALRVELPTNGTGVIATVGAVTAITNALPAGTNAIGKLAANSGVDIGDVDVTTVGTITPGTAASSLGKAEDAGHTSGDVGVMMLGIRNDALAATAGTDLDYIPPTLAADGRIVTVAAPTAAMVTGTASVTDTTSTSLISAGAGSLRNYITAVQFANTGSTTVLVTLQDGSGGTALARSIIPAGGGSNIYYDIPIKTTAATALYFAAGGSSTTVYASAQGYRAL